MDLSSIFLILISALFHSCWNLLTKRGNLSGESLFWVFLCGVLFYLPFFVAFGVFPSFILQTPLKLWWLTILSGFLEAIYFICLVEAYRRGDLSFIYPMSRSAPIFTQIWAILLIGEVLTGRGILGICLVVIGLFVVSLRDFRFENIVQPMSHFGFRPYLLALTAAIASSIYSVIDKIGVQVIHPVFYMWLLNFWIGVYVGLYLLLRGESSFLRVWKESKKEILMITVLQNLAYIPILMAMQMSKVSYVVAFRQVGVLFAAGMGIVFLKEEHWKPRLIGALILTLGLVLIGLAKQ